MSEATVDRLLVESDPVLHLVAELAYRCVGGLPIADAQTLRDALSDAVVHIGGREVSLEYLPLFPDSAFPISDIADFIWKAKAAVAFAHAAAERGLVAHRRDLHRLVVTVAAATSPTDIPSVVAARPTRKGA